METVLSFFFSFEKIICSENQCKSKMFFQKKIGCREIVLTLLFLDYEFLYPLEQLLKVPEMKEDKFQKAKIVEKNHRSPTFHPQMTS